MEGPGQVASDSVRCNIYLQAYIVQPFKDTMQVAPVCAASCGFRASTNYSIKLSRFCYLEQQPEPAKFYAVTWNNSLKA